MMKHLALSLLPFVLIILASHSIQAQVNFPDLLSSNPEDANWDDRFNLTGTDKFVFAIAAHGDFIYIGGEFTEVGGKMINNIARWDGRDWSTLGSGTIGGVTELLISGDDLYAVGTFSLAGGTSNIAKWDGNNWSFLGSGVNNFISAIAASGNNIYVGGQFTEAGGKQVNHLACWDGQNWNDVGGGVNSEVYCMAANGTEIYAGGIFTQAGNVSANHIAKWDGAKWSSLGNGVAGIVTAITVNGQEVYVAAYQNQIETSSIMKWNGSQWTTLIQVDRRSYLTELTFKDSTLYVGGFFQGIAGKNISYLAQWNGAAWLPVGEGNIDGGVHAMALRENEILIGGVFENVDGLHVRHVASWNGKQWSMIGIGKGLNAEILSMVVDRNNIYTGGVFTSAGQTLVNHIAKWNGQDWESLGTGVNGGILALGVSGHEIYAGGAFFMAGEVEAQNVAKWDGEKWAALATGVNSTVNAMAVSGTNVYIGGYFNKAGEWSTRHIAKWDGSSWSVLGSGTNGRVNVIATHENEVIVSGNFTTAGGRDLVNIAKWDGNDWSSFGDGMLEGGYASAIEIHEGEIYFAGWFPRLTPPETIQVVKWDGNRWSMLGGEAGGFPGLIYDMVIVGDELYVAGSYMMNLEFVTYGISRWDGENWWPLGSGLEGAANALGFIGSELYAGGFFKKAGNKQSAHFAHWSIPPSARNDLASTDEEMAVTVNVLANDRATNRGININSLTLARPPANGALRNDGNGNLTYTPALDFFGSDSFQYRVQDNEGYASNAATVTLTVKPINDPPGAFTRLLPKDSSVVHANIIRFVWSPAQNVDRDTIMYFMRLAAGHLDTSFTTPDTALTVNFLALRFEGDSLTVNWSVVATDGRLATQPANGAGAFTLDLMTGIESPSIAKLPTAFALFESYPNPLSRTAGNPITTLRYELPIASHVRLEIYDLLGRKICVLVDQEHSPGAYEARWNSLNEAGIQVDSGIYFYRLQAKGKHATTFVATRKLLVIR
jgi:hypothetical protein